MGQVVKDLKTSMFMIEGNKTHKEKIVKKTYEMRTGEYE